MSETLFPTIISYEQITGSYVNGIFVKATPVVSTFSGSVQPLTFKDMQALEVGREDMGKIKVYSSTELNVSIEGTSNSGDVIIWQGKRWEIIQALNYQMGIISHYKYIAELRDA